MLAVVRHRGGYLRHNALNIAIVILPPPFLPALLQIFRRAFTLGGFKYVGGFAL
jgi:hypothetical protein